MPAKTRKSIAKRFKITAKKIIHRPPGQNHFRAKKTSKQLRRTKQPVAAARGAFARRIIDRSFFG